MLKSDPFILIMEIIMATLIIGGGLFLFGVI